MVPVALAGHDFDGRVVLAVVERKLRAQQLERVVRVALAVAQEAAHMIVLHRGLLDGRLAKGIALARVEPQIDGGRAQLAVHLHLVAQHARIQIAVGRRGVLETVLELLVGRVTQAVAAVNGQRRGDAGEDRVRGAGTLDLHADRSDQHRWSRIDADADVPVVLLVRLLDRGADVGVVVAEWPQCLAHFIVDAVVEPLYGGRLDAIVILVALEAEQREDVAAHLAIDSVDVDAGYQPSRFPRTASRRRAGATPRVALGVEPRFEQAARDGVRGRQQDARGGL